MSRTALLTAALAASSLAGLAAAQDQRPAPPPEPPAAAGEQPEIEMADGEVVFRDPLTNEVLDVPEEDVTEAVEEFHQTGMNPYTGDDAAAAEGKELYGSICAACHLPDATGRIGPNLVDDTVKYPRVANDVGMFEVIYAGAAGAMQPFADRFSQDEMLKIMGYLAQLQQAQQ